MSEDLPLVDVEHRPRGRLVAGSAVAVGAVDDARPDRWGERVIQYIDRPKRLSLMEYLYFAGDDRFGALGVSTSATEYLPRPGGPLPRLEQAQELSEVVAKVAAAEPISEIERRVLASGGSFGGAKPKALVDIGGEQWLMKFINGEPVDSPLIEHATMTLASKAGIRVGRNARHCACGAARRGRAALRSRGRATHTQHLGGDCTARGRRRWPGA